MRLLILLIFLVLAAQANSQSAVTVWGYGATESCGQWLTDRKEGEPREAAGKHWVVGFLSGQAFKAKADVLRALDSEAIFAEIDKYCRDNPSHKVITATADLFKKISGQSK